MIIMGRKKLEKKLNKKLHKHYGTAVRAGIEEDIIRVTGTLSNWQDIVDACSMCVQKGTKMHVVNDIVLEGVTMPRMRTPVQSDGALEGRRPDVLIIGGGISGASIARELTKWKLDILLVEKEADLAVQASGRNDGEVHPGVDLGRGTRKQYYVLRGNKMYGKICRELDVPFERCGQYVGFTHWWMYPAVLAYVWHRKHICKVTDTVLLSRKELRRKEKELNPDICFAIYNPSAGCVCPYGLTIAYGENAVENGAEISLDTAVLGMETEDGMIKCVRTNRGRIYPSIVVNAAGTFAEDIAAMAGDRFYSIHPRRGTNSILDKKAGHIVRGIASVKTLRQKTAHTKGGGILHTVHGNLLVGPNAQETYEKENFATMQESIDAVFAKQKMTAAGLDKKDIITYFTGVRPATFEEDFIIEKGRRTKNLIHCAGIQSPGLTTAPAVALDVEEMAVTELRSKRTILRNENFNPVRRGVPVLKNMPKEERDKMIQENPDYGIIVCRCEEISKGEIVDALKAPIVVPTLDGIKKRLRPGMGRCQGGFCMPLVVDIISEYMHIPPGEVKKAGAGSVITYGRTKGKGGGSDEECI